MNNQTNQTSILNDVELEQVAGGFWKELFTGTPATPPPSTGGGKNPGGLRGALWKLDHEIISRM
jgi:hypothetical protein